VTLFDIAQKENRLKELEGQTNEPDFWSNQENSAKVLQEIKFLKDKVIAYKKLQTELSDLEILIELALESNEDSVIPEVKSGVKQLKKGVDKLETENLLSGNHDRNNAIITIHPGAGGTESQDWAQMLYRMYTMWTEKNGFKLEELDYLDGEVAHFVFLECTHMDI